MQLQKGQKSKFNDLNISTHFTAQCNVKGLAVDISCFGVNDQNKLEDDRYMVFYNQPSSPNREIIFTQNETNSSFNVDLQALPSSAHKLVFTAAVDGSGNMSQLEQLTFTIGDASFTLSGKDFAQEKAIVIAEVYQKDLLWRLSAVGQGFNGGLDALLVSFGGEVAPSPTPVLTPSTSQVTSTNATPQATSKVNLSKVTLEKQGDSHKVSLVKGNANEITINLNWTQNTQSPQKKGLLNSLFSSGSNEIDLDLGVFYELSNGDRSVIDGIQFAHNRGGPRNRRSNQGQYTGEPWIWHTGDDRSGTGQGENVLINPAGIHQIKRIIVYCFIFKGAARWAETNGVVTVKVPGSPEIVVEMGQSTEQKKFCAIAELLFDERDSVTVKKLLTFHEGHEPCDKYYHWGMNWQAGSK